MHDDGFLRTCGVDKYAWEVNWDEIKTYDAGSFFSEEFAGTRIPLLSEVIDYAKDTGMKIIIEIKPSGHEKDFEQAVIDIIHEKNFEKDCYIASLNYSVLIRTKEISDDIPTLYIMSLAYGDLSRLEYADAYSVEETSVNSSLVKKVHNAGKVIFVWTVSKKENMKNLIGMGVDNIITNDVELANETSYEYNLNGLKINETIKNIIETINNYLVIQ